MADTHEVIYSKPGSNGPKYMCCDHCGINFPDMGESYCEKYPNTHLVMCNEPGCELGKTEVNNAKGT